MTYRKEDIMDLLSCLKDMQKVQGVKKSDIKKKRTKETRVTRIFNFCIVLEKGSGRLMVLGTGVEPVRP